MRGVGLPDIHEYSAGLWVVNGHPGFGASQSLGGGRDFEMGKQWVMDI